MSKRVRASVDQLKDLIRQFASDTKKTVDQKIRDIFQIEKAEYTLTGEGLNPWLNSSAWNELKQDRVFWSEIIHDLGFVDYDEVTQSGEKKFGIPEITRILGDYLGAEIEAEAKQQANKQTLLLTTDLAHIYANEAFISYMNWYEANASRNYLILYGRYLAIMNLLVPLERTRPQSPSLEIALDETYYVVSQLLIIDNGTPNLLWFTMKKEPASSFVFTIRSGATRYEIPMNGPILRVLKFFYQGVGPTHIGIPTAEELALIVRQDTTFLVISGPNDNKLLRFNHNKISDVLIVDQFRLNVDEFDDLSYVNTANPSRFATNRKSQQRIEENFTNVTVLDVSRFRNMIPQKITTPEEKKRLLKDLIKERGVGGGVPEEYINIQTEYNQSQFGPLFVTVDMPLTTRFQFSPSQGHKKDETVPLAFKLIRMPFETETFFAYIALLVRTYTDDIGSSKLQLFLYRYVQNINTDVFAIRNRETFDLSPFLSPDTFLCYYSIEEFNIIFHTGTLFYIEVLERRGCERTSTFHFVNSEVLQFDFKFTQKFIIIDEPLVKPLVPLSTIKDNALFEKIRVRGYKIYDYRHDPITLIVGRKYDAIFYKYDNAKREAHLVFYKAHLDRPGVGFIYIPNLAPQQVLAFVFRGSINELAFLSFVDDNRVERIANITQIHPFELYNEARLELSQCLQTQLTLKEDCILCGKDPTLQDAETKHLYCTDLCQYIYCKTDRL